MVTLKLSGARFDYENRLDSWRHIVDHSLDIVGAQKKEYLGGGAWGLAVAISDKEVLKITKHELEYNNAKRLEGHNFTNLVDIYETFKIIGEHNNFYIIRQELLQPLSMEEKVIMGLLSMKVNINRIESDVRLAKEISRCPSFNFNSFIDDEFNYHINGRRILMVMEFLKDIRGMHKEANELDVFIGDLHQNNVGYKNGHLAMLDIT